jgi:hypothetical protein
VRVADRSDIATKYKSPLVVDPSEGMAKYAAFEQAVFSESQQIDVAAAVILKELVFGPRSVYSLTTRSAACGGC